MSKLIRFINQGIKHFFILDGENLCDGRHEFKNCHPDPFADSQFMAVTRHLSEELSDSLVIHETLHGREYIVLKSYEGGACYLCCKVGRLALAKPQQSFTFLEDDLLRLASGIDFIHFKESQPQVCSKQSVPRTSLAPVYEEQAYMDVGKYLQQRILAVAPALATKERLLIHFYTLNHVHNGKHCIFRFVIFEKCANF